MDQYKYWSILLLQEAAAAKGTTIWLWNTADTTDYSSCIWGELSLTANMLQCLQKHNIKHCVSHASVILNWTLVKILSCSTVHCSCVRVAAKKLVLFCCVKTTKMFLRKKNICFKTNSLLYICLFLHPEAEKRNHFSFMNKSGLNMQYSLTEFSTLIINEYYIIDVIYVISGIYSTFHRSPNCSLYFP